MTPTELVCQHHALARAAAFRWASKHPAAWPFFDDLKQDAAEALVRAAATWTEGTGVPFAAYANICISRQMIRSLGAYVWRVPLTTEHDVPDHRPSPVQRAEFTLTLLQARDWIARRRPTPTFNRDFTVLCRRLLGDANTEELGAELGLSRQRVHQIEQRMRGLLDEWRAAA